MNLFSYSSYLEVLREQIRVHEAVRGYQARLATAAGTHSSHLSRVLNHELHLTPDHAANLCVFWGWNERESEYFLALVSLARAATPALRRLLENRVKELRSAERDLSTHLTADDQRTSDQGIYYSAWYYSAAHVLLTIPGFQTEPKLVERLQLPLAQVRDILKTLETLGLARKSGSEWKPTKTNIHLSNHSWMAGVHHANWRLKAIERLPARKQDSIHYSGLHSVSLEDFEQLRQLAMKHLVEVDRIVRPSREEELFVLNLDLFRF